VLAGARCAGLGRAHLRAALTGWETIGFLRSRREGSTGEGGERVEGSWVASIPFRRFDLAKEGGNLVLTERHLLFKPLRTPVVVGDVILMTKGSPSWIVPLSEVRRVEPVAERRSQLRIETADGKSRNVNVVAGRMARIKNPDNVVTRDQAIERIRAAAG